MRVNVTEIVAYRLLVAFFFFFNDTATTEIYTLSLHDALPICGCAGGHAAGGHRPGRAGQSRAHLEARPHRLGDRKSTRLNSSHANISYAVFCLKKKKKHNLRRISQLIFTLYAHSTVKICQLPH